MIFKLRRQHIAPPAPIVQVPRVVVQEEESQDDYGFDPIDIDVFQLQEIFGVEGAATRDARQKLDHELAVVRLVIGVETALLTDIGT